MPVSTRDRRAVDAGHRASNLCPRRGKEPVNEADDDVLKLLDLVTTSGDTLRSETLRAGDGPVFGGQLMAQSLAAAGRSVPPDKPLISFHASFVSGATVSAPIDYLSLIHI